MRRYFLFILLPIKMNGYGAFMLRLILALLLAVLATGGVRTIYPNDSQNIALRSLPLDPAHPGPRRVGDLIFLSAWELLSDNENFGGISALTVLPSNRFVGLSDAGTLIGFGLAGRGTGSESFITPLPGVDDNGSNYRDRDSEGMAHDPATGQFWVSYEARHAIRRFNRSFARSTGTARPGEMQDWPSNKGGECLIRLADGRFVVIAESLEDDASHQALLFSGDPVETGTGVARFTYRPPRGYRVTDGVQLPDGRLLILNREIGLPNGFAAKLALVDTGRIGRGEIVKGKVIATLAAPLLIDNMEGVAVAQAGGDTMIWLVSDNNFSIFQRTLLMQFRLAERAPVKRREAAAAPGFDSI